MRNKKKLGIIGGLGPFASSHWYKMILDIISKKYNLTQDYEYPEIYIFSLSMTGWSEKGIEDEDKVKKDLLYAVRNMELLGINYLIISCNTAHIYYEYLQENTSIQIISLIDTCIKYVQDMGYSSIGVLSSESTKNHGLYINEFNKAGIKNIKSKFINEQDMINGVILSVQGNNQNDYEKDIMKRIIHSMYENGAKAIILGCTELPLSIEQNDIDIPLIDSGIILLNKISELLYE